MKKIYNLPGFTDLLQLTDKLYLQIDTKLEYNFRCKFINAKLVADLFRQLEADFRDKLIVNYENT